MTGTIVGGVLAEAETIVRKGIPGVRAARTPAGLAIVLPLDRRNGYLVSLYLRQAGGALRLFDGSAVHGHDLPGAMPCRGRLARHGLSYDDATGETYCTVHGLDSLVECSESMGRALLSLDAAPEALDLAA